MVFAIRAEPAPIQFDDHGVARIGGTRVTLETLLWTYLQGASAEEIVESFPSLELADVYAVIAYYLRHKGELDTYLKLAEAKEQEVRNRYEVIFPQEGLRDKLLARRKAAQDDDRSPSGG